MLNDLGLLQESAPETFRGARPTVFKKSERQKLLRNIRNMPRLADIDHYKCHSSGEISFSIDGDANKIRFSTGVSHSFPRNRCRGRHTILAFTTGNASSDTIDGTSFSANNHPATTNEGSIERPTSFPSEKEHQDSSHRQLSSRRSLVQRTVKSQSAWGAIYKFEQAAHQRETHHHDHQYHQYHSDPLLPRTALAIRSGNDRDGVDECALQPHQWYSHSLLGWESLRRRLSEMEDEGNSILLRYHILYGRRKDQDYKSSVTDRGRRSRRH